jgi:hypothetical protein
MLGIVMDHDFVAVAWLQYRIQRHGLPLSKEDSPNLRGHQRNDAAIELVGTDSDIRGLDDSILKEEGKVSYGTWYGVLVIRVKVQRYKPLSLSIYTSVARM